VGKIAMFSALSGAAWLLGLILIGGANYPDYNHLTQYISELGATGAPYGPEVSWFGFAPVGVFVIAFAVSALLAAPKSLLSVLGFLGIVLFAIGYLGATFFPCDYGCRPENPSPSQLLHLMFGLAGYILAPLTLLLLGLAARRWPSAGVLPIAGYIGAVLALVGFLTLDPNSPLVGLSQRVLEASVIGWVVLCGLYLGRQPRER